MAGQKGGIKLRRAAKKKGSYQAQYLRTKRNKVKQYRKATALTKSERHKAWMQELIARPAGSRSA